ncbi:protein farnesyltransferase [Saccharomycopsis crataegensis]|uniref:Protein farnesyltransferase subunit beta n=1 Tax=Saccharomycopsis crataegensis TaxID=43959 RepID=A0AAV5QSU7_9ASCO|nr:protein farnesyltransferase [Saccharomycopsis crataegensis]
MGGGSTLVPANAFKRGGKEILFKYRWFMIGADINVDEASRIKDVEKVNFLLSLLGRKRTVSTRESNSTDYQYENMLQLVENYKNRINFYNDDDTNTVTIKDQKNVENSCHEIYASYVNDDNNNDFPKLAKREHLHFLSKSFKTEFPGSYVVLDSSQTWILYWIANALMLLGVELEEEKEQIAKKVLVAQNNQYGGIGGGEGQLGHIASTYSALLVFSYSENKDFWSQIDRKKMYHWMMTDLKQPNGSFAMHKGGEVDTRAVYCALTVASMLNIMTPELIEGTAEWLGKCQTLEGGFGGSPSLEAHGGYSFCAVASLCLLGDPKTMLSKYCNLPNLIKWSVDRQGGIEGGFSGRSNKLVDGCYSHWIGGIFPFLEAAIQNDNNDSFKGLFNRNGLSNYILGCCQDIEGGGLFDKPGCRPDFYHTNYTLVGLSHCQHQYSFDYKKYELLKDKCLDAAAYCYDVKMLKDDSVIEFCKENMLRPINPVFGAVNGYVEAMRQFYFDSSE